MSQTQPVITGNLTEIPTQAQVRGNKSVFGNIGENHAYCTLPYKMKLAWDLKVEINRFTCNEKIKANLENVFTQTLDHYGLARIQQMRLDMFGGCYANRATRHGKTKSMHAWACAVDLDPNNNRLRWGADQARFAHADYDAFWDIVEANGGVSLGREWGKDFMHFQFARL